MRLDKVDMARIYEHQPKYVRFFNLTREDMTDAEWNSFCAMPMLVKEVFVSGSEEVIAAAKLQYPVTEYDNGYFFKGKRNELIVEMDITSKCNLACPNCVRFSNFTSTWESLSIDEIREFIRVNKHYGKTLTIKVIGGEPLVHPDINTILVELGEHFHMMLATNGIMEFWSPPFPMVIENSAKEKGVLPEFHATCDAPIDDPKYDYEDFGLGCDTAYTCENVYTVDGFYPCTVAGSIDRMLRLEGGPRQGMTSFATETLSSCVTPENKKKVFQSLCGYCGFYKKMGFHEAKNTTMVRTTEQVYSESWEFMRGKK